MYESFFGFDERPFELTPNSKFLFPSRQHEGVMRTLLYGIERRAGFMMLAGEVGSGKTTTIRAMLNALQESVETSLILNPLLSNKELIKSIIRDFGIDCKSESPIKQIEALNQYLLRLNEQGKTALVVVDEAQNLTFEAFEMTRMLSNLETESQKLINVLFVGQPELEDLLAEPRLRQLAQRIKIHAKLSSLSFDETVAYITHRIACSGARVSAHFETNAIKKIFKSSGGIPRLINNLCDLGLLAAYSRNTRIIDKRIISEALKEVPKYVYHS